VNAGRRFSQAISEGDGISLIASVRRPDDAVRVEEEGAEAVLAIGGEPGLLEQIRAATSLPVVFFVDGDESPRLPEADACILDGHGDRGWLEQVHADLRAAWEVAFRIDDEEELEEVLENFDPEIVVLAPPAGEDEEALERVLDLLPDVPAGKLAIAELPGSSAEDVAALERAGFDGVIVEPDRVPELAGPEPHDV
jgi:hypothetical protein